MAKTTGWAPCGARLVDHVPFGHSLPGNGLLANRERGQTQTFIAALRHDRLDAPWVLDGAPLVHPRMHCRAVDEPRILRPLCRNPIGPDPAQGRVVILDNLATHRSPKAAAILKDIGAWFVFRGKPSTGRLSDPSNSCRHTPPT